MSFDLLSALAVFALVSVITPGPNNLMLMASGANFGWQRSLPHMLGVGLGFPLMVVMVGLGVMQVFELFPPAFIALQIASVAYLLYLAWKIATAAPPGEAEATGTPLTFLQAAVFQWVNPKAWSMALGAITLYAPGRSLNAVLWVAGCYVAVGVISTNSWTGLGTALHRILRNPVHLRAFNLLMAALLVGSLAFVLWR